MIKIYLFFINLGKATGLHDVIHQRVNVKSQTFRVAGGFLRIIIIGTLHEAQTESENNQFILHFRRVSIIRVNTPGGPFGFFCQTIHVAADCFFGGLTSDGNF